MSTKTVLTILGLTLGFFFIFMGTIKLTPIFNEDIYRQMRKMFIRETKVFPFSGMTGWKPDPHVYRKCVGCLEVVCGVTMAFIPGVVKNIANILLFIEMIGAAYTHWALEEPFDRLTPSLIFGMLLACRFIMNKQYLDRMENEEKEMAGLRSKKAAAEDRYEELVRKIGEEEENEVKKKK
ncbi:novel acetylcholine receptor chaperone-like [Lineus longissimus]|uniref:novel acetylcholine receptor chaperone-like n=1 Tax=Lineus longissimus TaxID=88925 RepID=UPI002B4F35E0